MVPDITARSRWWQGQAFKGTEKGREGDDGRGRRIQGEAEGGRGGVEEGSGGAQGQEEVKGVTSLTSEKKHVKDRKADDQGHEVR